MGGIPGGYGTYQNQAMRWDISYNTTKCMSICVIHEYGYGNAHETCNFQKPVSQGALPMVNVSNDADMYDPLPGNFDISMT